MVSVGLAGSEDIGIIYQPTVRLSKANKDCWQDRLPCALPRPVLRQYSAPDFRTVSQRQSSVICCNQSELLENHDAMPLNREEVSTAILSNLTQAIKKSGRSENAISTGIGRNRGWLRTALKSGSIPNLVDLYLIAQELGVEIAEFFPREDQKSSFTDRLQSEVFSTKGFDGPETHDFLKWHMENGGRLQNHEWLLEYTELFSAPDEEQITLQPVRVGRETIVARILGLETPQDVLNFVSHHSEDDRKAIIAEHLKVLSTKKISIVPRTYDYQIAPGHSAKIEFLRILLPVQSETGEPMVMGLSKPLKFFESIEAVRKHDDQFGDPTYTRFKVL